MRTDAFEIWKAVVALGCVATLAYSLCPKWLSRAFDATCKRFCRLDAFAKCGVAVCLALATMYGGSKGFVWTRVNSDGADTIAGTSFLGVYTGVSNDVQTVGGQEVTNKVYLMQVKWTGSGITTNTPVSFRNADTEEWTEVVKSNCVTSAEASTNAMTFVVGSDKHSKRYWYVGTDTPAVVIVSSGIILKSFEGDGAGVTLTWECDDPRATTFRVSRKLATDSDWTDCGVEVSETTVRVQGFYLDKEWIWRITSDFLEDGE